MYIHQQHTTTKTLFIKDWTNMKWCTGKIHNTKMFFVQVFSLPSLIVCYNGLYSSLFLILTCGKVTVSKYFVRSVNLSVTHVEILDPYAILHVKTSKTDPFCKGVSIHLHISDHTNCPFFSFKKKYIWVRKDREASFCFSVPMFIKENGSALDRHFFIRGLKHILDICGYNSSLYNDNFF